MGRGKYRLSPAWEPVACSQTISGPDTGPHPIARVGRPGLGMMDNASIGCCSFSFDVPVQRRAGILGFISNPKQVSQAKRWSTSVEANLLTSTLCMHLLCVFFCNRCTDEWCDSIGEVPPCLHGSSDGTEHARGKPGSRSQRRLYIRRSCT